MAVTGQLGTSDSYLSNIQLGAGSALAPIATQAFCCDITAGPPIRGAPWQQHLPSIDYPLIMMPPARTADSYMPDVTGGPPVMAAPWQLHLPIVFPPRIVTPPPPPTPSQVYAPEVTFGPPMRGAPWAQRLFVERQEFQGPALRTGGPPGTTPAIKSKPLLERVPDATGPAGQDRLRRHTEKLSNIINSLVEQNLLRQIGVAKWTLNPAAAVDPTFVGLTGTFP